MDKKINNTLSLYIEEWKSFYTNPQESIIKK